MVIQRKDVGNLSKRLSQPNLIPVARIVVKVRMLNLLVMLGRPLRILAVFLSAHGSPLPQQRNLFPQPIGKDLVAQTKLGVEATTFNMLLKDILPHEADAAKPSALIRGDGNGKVVSAVCDETPGSLVAASDKELVAGAAEVGGDGIGPFGALVLIHRQIDIVPVEEISLVAIDWVCLELARIGAQVDALVNMNGWWMSCISDEQDASQP